VIAYLISVTVIIASFMNPFIPCAISEDKSIGMVTGSKTGTYYRFGQEIADKAVRSGLDIIVKESEGSIANIERLISSENAGFAMVQSDVLSFLKRSTDPGMRKTAGKLRLIYPFYKEEVHIFANKDIRKFEDIQGKRLVLGVERSGNWLTSNNLLHITGVEPKEKMYLKPPEAVVAVLKGDADAMVYVVGKPASLFTNLEEVKSSYPQLFEKVNFVPLDDPKIVKHGYVSAEITSDDYPWFNDKIQTVAVKALLVCFDFSSRRDNYYRMRCDQLYKLDEAIRNNINELKQTGHPKWKEVNLDEKIESWEWDACSRKVPYNSNSGSSDLSNELLRILKGK